MLILQHFIGKKKYLMPFMFVSSVKNIMLWRRNAASDNFRPPETMH